METIYLAIHSDNPQPRLIAQAVEILHAGGVIVYPTDSAYALGCRLEDKDASERIRRIRHLDQHHNFTLMCRDLSDIATYAYVDNSVFRLLKANTPGGYTFILPATREVPRRLLHPKRKTIGIRIPDNKIALAILAAMGEPIMSVTLIMPEHTEPLADPEEIRQQLSNQVDAIIDGGFCGIEPTTVVNFTDAIPSITRIGKGDPAPFAV